MEDKRVDLTRCAIFGKHRFFDLRDKRSCCYGCGYEPGLSQEFFERADDWGEVKRLVRVEEEREFDCEVRAFCLECDRLGIMPMKVEEFSIDRGIG